MGKNQAEEMNARALKESFSEDFVKFMKNRILVAYYKYVLPTGKKQREIARESDFPACAKDRLDQYLKTGNTEFLVDAANFAMLEFLYPQVPGAKFTATDSRESPGIINRLGKRTHRGEDAK